MIIIGIIVISAFLLAIFMATTIAGGRYHDEQKRIRDTADAALTARVREERARAPDCKP